MNLKQNRCNNCVQLLDKFKILEYLPEGNIVVLPIVNSTNQYIIDHLLRLESGFVCVTEYQRDGRGKCGRHWISSFAKSICLSLYWKIKSELVIDVNLSVMVGIIILEILHNLGISSVQMKLPNDLYFDNRKLGGILIERVLRMQDFYHHLVIGIGINLMESKVISEYIGNKWSNLLEAGIYFDRNILVAALIYGLRRFFCIFERYGYHNTCNHTMIKLLLARKILRDYTFGLRNVDIFVSNQGGDKFYLTYV